VIANPLGYGMKYFGGNGSSENPKYNGKLVLEI
jgi:hypothetical protein